MLLVAGAEPGVTGVYPDYTNPRISLRIHQHGWGLQHGRQFATCRDSPNEQSPCMLALKETPTS
jgi:hypothetical protein